MCAVELGITNDLLAEKFVESLAALVTSPYDQERVLFKPCPSGRVIPPFVIVKPPLMVVELSVVCPVTLRVDAVTLARLVLPVTVSLLRVVVPLTFVLPVTVRLFFMVVAPLILVTPVILVLPVMLDCQLH